MNPDMLTLLYGNLNKHHIVQDGAPQRATAGSQLTSLSSSNSYFKTHSANVVYDGMRSHFGLFVPNTLEPDPELIYIVLSFIFCILSLLL